jgi:hypothetical protein
VEHARALEMETLEPAAEHEGRARRAKEAVKVGAGRARAVERVGNKVGEPRAATSYAAVPFFRTRPDLFKGIVPADPPSGTFVDSKRYIGRLLFLYGHSRGCNYRHNLHVVRTYLPLGPLSETEH